MHISRLRHVRCTDNAFGHVILSNMVISSFSFKTLRNNWDRCVGVFLSNCVGCGSVLGAWEGLLDAYGVGVYAWRI